MPISNHCKSSAYWKKWNLVKVHNLSKNPEKFICSFELAWYADNDKWKKVVPNKTWGSKAIAQFINPNQDKNLFPASAHLCWFVALLRCLGPVIENAPNSHFLFSVYIELSSTSLGNMSTNKSYQNKSKHFHLNFSHKPLCCVSSAKVFWNFSVNSSNLRPF